MYLSNNSSRKSKIMNRIKHTIAVSLILANCSLAFAAPPKLTRFKLNNGIRVVNLYVEGSKDVGIYSFLPLGLVTDGKEKTQWSHLIEHLTLRTTGAVDFKTSNAETMADNMRLDYYGNSDTWMQGVKQQAKWLSGLPFSPESLAEELPKALAELDYVEANLATHKFAQAAWNQVFRHGETDIAMRGDIQSAQLSDLQKYRDLHLVQADRVLLCVIGGVEMETLKPAMEEHLGSISMTAKTFPKLTVSPDIAKDQIATWDVKTTHYMETYAIPNLNDSDYPALFLASMLLRMSCMRDVQLKELTGSAFCGVDLITPEQVYLYISASIKPNTDIDKVKSRVRELINVLRKPENNTQVGMFALSLSMQLSSLPDITMLMQQKPDGISETMMLLQLGLTWGMLEYQYGDTLQLLPKAVANVSAEDVADVVNRYLSDELRMTLVLTPLTSE